MIRDLLGEHRKRREEEDEARNLIEEMQRNVDEAQNESNEFEQNPNRILWEHIKAFDKERERSRLMMTKNSGKMIQSRETKILSLEKDLGEILGKIKQTNRLERNNQDKEVLVARRRGRAETPAQSWLKPQMKSIVFLVAGWVTVKEMKAPQGLCVRTSIMAREQWMTRCGKI